MPLYDFKCPDCNWVTEDIVSSETETVPCEKCRHTAQKIYVGCAKQLTTIIPSYPGCLRQKAGYVHTHGDRPATKIQSGYGGCTKPS